MRAVETTPAASPNVGEEVTLVERAQWKINQPPSLEKNERAWKGDYPLLDRKVEGGFASVLLAALALCFTVALLGNGHLLFIKDIYPTSSSNLESKLGNTFNIECIFVSRFAIDPKCLGSIDKRFSFSGYQLAPSDNGLADCGTRMEGSRCYLNRIRRWGSESFPRNLHGHASDSNKIIGRSLTKIFEHQIGSRSESSGNINYLNHMNRYISPQLPLSSVLHCIDGTLGCIGGFIGRIGSMFSIGEAVAYEPQLPHEQKNLNTSNNYQAEGKQSQQSSINRQPPFGRRFCIALVSIFFGLIWSLFGGNALYDKRHLLGAALILEGWFLAGGGILLYWLTFCPSTWGWFL